MDKLLQANCLFIKGKHREAFEAYMDILYNECNPTAASYEDVGVGFFNLALIQSFAEDV